MDIERLNGLFQEQIKDLHSGETQIIDGLPDMIDASSDDDLREALEHHLEETRTQKDRLERLAEDLGFTVGDHTCEGMKGILKEGSNLVEKETDADEVRDAAIIASAQRVEHYEMAGYGTARTLARTLRLNDAADLLQKTLDEEGAANEKLTKIAEGHVNRAAMAGD